MVARNVQFIFDLIDKFTGPSSSIAKAAATAEKSIAGMGKASDMAERSLANLGRGVGANASRAAQQIDMMTKAINAQTAAAAKAPPALAGYVKAAENAAYRQAALARQAQSQAAWAARGPGAPGKGTAAGGPPVVVGGGSGRWMDWWAKYHIAKGGARSVDHAVSRVADVDTQRRKLVYVLGSTPEAHHLADEAVMRAKEFSGRYKNTTVSENLHIFDDLRANLPESFHEILKDYAEPFVKLHSFFKGWKGGKHGNSVEQSLKDIDIAVRSGELGGNVTAKQMAQWAETLAIMRPFYGEKFNLGQYFTAQKSAKYALPGLSDRFKTTVFPAMIQSMGVGAGVALNTWFNKGVGGMTVHQATAEAWKDLGLVDMAMIRRKGLLDKKGKIRASGLAGNDWLLGMGDKDIQGNAYKANPDLYMMDKVLPAIAKQGKVKGLTPEVAKKVGDAYRTFDAATLAHILPTFVTDPSFIQAMMPLGKDRNATQNMWGIIERAASIARDQQGLSLLRSGKDAEFETYEIAKQKLAAQADRLVQIATGSDFIGNVNAALDALSNTFTRIGDKMQTLQQKYVDPWSGYMFEQFGHSINKERRPPTSWLPDHRPVLNAPQGFADEVRAWGNAPFASMALTPQPVSVTVTTPEVPIKVQTEVHVTGTVNGAIQGTGTGSGAGAAQVKADAPRGESSPPGK